MANLKNLQYRIGYLGLANLPGVMSTTFQTLTDGLGNSMGLEHKTTAINVVSPFTFTVNGSVVPTNFTDLDDVTLSGLADNDIMQHNGTAWVNRAVTGTTGLVTQTSDTTYALRTITADSSKLTVADGDGVAGNPALDVSEANVDHDLLTNFVTNEHLDHSGISITTTGNMLQGGGDLTSTRTIDIVDNVAFEGTEAIHIAGGTTGERPAGNPEGSLRKNTTTNEIEYNTGSTWITLPPAGAGEANTASNVGTAGVGIFKQKSASDFEMKKINGGSTKVTITDDTGNSELDIDIDGGLVLEGEVSSNGLVTRTASETYTNRTITNTTDETSVSNGNGASGNPTIGLADNLQFAGTEGINLAGGTTAQRPGSPVEGDLRKNTTTSAIEYYNGTAWAEFGADLVQIVQGSNVAKTSGSTTIPADDTIPQNTEGTEIATVSITPTSTSNTLVIHIAAPTCYNATGASYGIGIFQDSTADAIASANIRANGGFVREITAHHTMTAGTTSSTTFKFRLGSSAGTWNINGVGGRVHGGVIAATITVMEFKG